MYSVDLYAQISCKVISILHGYQDYISLTVGIIYKVCIFLYSHGSDYEWYQVLPEAYHITMSLQARVLTATLMFFCLQSHVTTARWSVIAVLIHGTDRGANVASSVLQPVRWVPTLSFSDVAKQYKFQ